MANCAAILKESPQGIDIYQPRNKAHDNILREACCIEKKSFPKHMAMTGLLDREVSKPRTTLLFCRDAGTLVGFALLAVGGGGAGASITKLVVREERRRQGHGERLLRAALSILRQLKAPSVQLHVDVERLAALALYEKLGFRREGLARDYYAVGRHALLMALDLCGDAPPPV